ncbi:hypothetical protein [Lacrimispora sp.]|uniref:hypothetical protein n=1 Tax=Lacrimispora sp. TaxID=2719234 RepID=UPI002899F4C0|nr:hypothetical protein [Lacrimispora sp.]
MRLKMVSAAGAYNLDLFAEYVAAGNDELPEAYQNTTGKVATTSLDGSVLLVNS